jgi:hypothetical protein
MSVDFAVVLIYQTTLNEGGGLGEIVCLVIILQEVLKADVSF